MTFVGSDERPVLLPGALVGDAADGTVKSVAKVLDLLEHLGAAGQPVGISDLARAAGLHVSTAHRLLRTLVRRGYVEQRSDTRRYALGPRVHALGGAYLGGSDLVGAAYPVIEELRDRLGETIHVAVWDDGQVLEVCHAETTQPVGVSLRLGRRDPAHATAIGKVLMAARGRAEVDRLLAGPLVAVTGHTVTATAKLRCEIERVRAQDYAVDDEELADGLCCVGVPVRDRHGRVVAGLSVAMPKARFDAARIPEWVAMLRAAADGLAGRLAG
ncbi:IclR family transcriptional regulator [Stella humosa]|uniref:IclR family transcriptional regulator n=1 Tax=Stella humosa TaxID=94 RepID=A0A3N1MEY6_9PROT|nr:IclR family transcriptional regulator [Stella humosa]ROQ01270.1 IclR family transcriptional regulator [Stella humosa]BBK31644.1 DNA-binding transcriptional regulator KdgR [Stella humosa]